MRYRTSGQALFVVALLLPVLLGLLLAAIELSWRSMITHEVTDALRAANRSAVQTLAYTAFAENRFALAQPDMVIANARRLSTINLNGIAGLVEPPGVIANAAHRVVLPAGGRCLLEQDGPSLHFAM